MGLLQSTQPMPALLQPFSTQLFTSSLEYILCNDQTGHFVGSPGSERLILAGSVGIVMIFFSTMGISSLREIVLLYDLDIFCPSSPGILAFLFNKGCGSGKMIFPEPSRYPRSLSLSPMDKLC